MNKGVGFADAIMRHSQTGEHYNAQEMSSAQESFQYIKNISDEYALSNQDRLGETDGLQKHLQTIASLSSSEVANLLGSEDAKLHQDFVQSLNHTKAALDQWRAAYSKQESLSHLQTYAASDQLVIQQNLNQQFIDFLTEKFAGDSSQVMAATELSNSSPEKKRLIAEFVGQFTPSQVPAICMTDIQERFKAELPAKPSEAAFEQKKNVFIEEHQPKIGHDFQDIKIEVSHLQARIRDKKEAVEQDLRAQSESVVPREEEVKSKIDVDTSLPSRASTHLASIKSLKSGGKRLYDALYKQEKLSTEDP